MYCFVINAWVIRHMKPSFVHIFRGAFFQAIWAHENHFLTKDANNGRDTLDYGVEVEFDQSSHAHYCDQNLIKGKLGYIGKIQEIMQVDFIFSMCYF